MYIKLKYNEKAKLLFTDTDSLMYEIETDDFYKDIAPDVRAMFDSSNYPKNHPLGIETGVNKKIIGMFKDEAGGKQIIEFVGLRAKLYSFKMLKTAAEIYEENKCKGIKKAVVKKHITFDDYKKCLFDHMTQMRTMNVLRSRKHNCLYIHTYMLYLDTVKSSVYTLYRIIYKIQLLITIINIYTYNC